MRKLLLVVALAASFAAVSASGASADYGQGAQYQIELSANLSSVQGGGIGGGVWLWIELDQNGGSYTGSDCGHIAGAPPAGATADSGDLNRSDWFYSNADGSSNPSGDYVTVTGITLNGLGGYPVTVTVPKAYGHYTGSIGSFITLPFPPSFTSLGFSQVQVAQ